MTRTSVTEIRTILSSASIEALPGLIAVHSADDRAGVRALVSSAVKRLEREQAEERRLEALERAECELRASGCVCVAGIDEVGRGALAGPLTVCAVVLPPGARIVGLDDSKALRPERREELAEQIRAIAVTLCVAHIEAHRIDSLGMTAALRRAMDDALAGLSPSADHALVDGRPIGLSVPETAIVKGDRKVAAIAAASIVAKVTRDALMRGYDEVYPGYGFLINKGYGTREHMEAIDRMGPTEIHRRSFGPCTGTMPLF